MTNAFIFCYMITSRIFFLWIYQRMVDSGIFRYIIHFILESFWMFKLHVLMVFYRKRHFVFFLNFFFFFFFQKWDIYWGKCSIYEVWLARGMTPVVWFWFSWNIMAARTNLFLVNLTKSNLENVDFSPYLSDT